MDDQREADRPAGADAHRDRGGGRSSLIGTSRTEIQSGPVIAFTRKEDGDRSSEQQLSRRSPHYWRRQRWPPVPPSPATLTRAGQHKSFSLRRDQRRQMSGRQSHLGRLARQSSALLTPAKACITSATRRFDHRREDCSVSRHQRRQAGFVVRLLRRPRQPRDSQMFVQQQRENTRNPT
jgi:hypothetical protein